MTKTKKTGRGGKRAGAGRPRSEDPASTRVLCRLNSAQVAKCNRLRRGTDGMATVLQRLLDEAEDPGDTETQDPVELTGWAP